MLLSLAVVSGLHRVVSQIEDFQLEGYWHQVLMGFSTAGLQT